MDGRIKHEDSEGEVLNYKMPRCWERIWIGRIKVIANLSSGLSLTSSLIFSVAVKQVL